MQQLSRRISNVKSSPTVALNAKAKALAKEGVKVLSFAVGEPDFATPTGIVDKAVEALRAGQTRYGPAGGSLELRQAIATKHRLENGLTFDPNDVVVGIGAKEVLFHTFLAVLNDGDEVLVPSPYWVSYPDQIIAAGAVPIPVPMAPDPAAQPFAVKDLERLVTPRTKAIVLNSPNNPAGYVFDRAFLAELGSYLATKPWWVISDEIYEYLAFDRPHISPLAVTPALKDRFILAHGMSKGFAMTGWRVGWVAGPSNVMKLVRDLQSHSSTCLPPFIETAATWALGQGRELLKTQIEDLRRRRDLAVSLVQSVPDIEFATPQGAFYLFVDVRRTLAKTRPSLDAYALSERLLLEHHVAMVPGDAFGAPGWLRISYATGDAVIKEGMERLRGALGRLADL